MHTDIQTALPLDAAQLSRAAAVAPVEQAVERFLDGTRISESGAEFAEAFLNDMNLGARPDLVRVAHELQAQMTRAKLVVELDYFRSKRFEHPIPVITARTQSGEYVVPNSNTVWNYLPEIERAGRQADPSRKLTIAPDSTSERERGRSPRARGEVFAADEPVSFMILPPRTVDAPAYVHPICSEAAFSAALRHAAKVIKRDEVEVASFIRDDVLYPEARKRILEQTRVFGERDTPFLVDQGSPKGGELFRLKVIAPAPAEHGPLELVCTVDYKDGEYVLRLRR